MIFINLIAKTTSVISIKRESNRIKGTNDNCYERYCSTETWNCNESNNAVGFKSKPVGQERTGPAPPLESKKDKSEEEKLQRDGGRSSQTLRAISRVQSEKELH